MGTIPEPWTTTRLSPLSANELKALNLTGCFAWVEQSPSPSVWDKWFVAIVPSSLINTGLQAFRSPNDIRQGVKFDPQSDWECRRK